MNDSKKIDDGGPAAWFVKDLADGWIFFDNEVDAKLQVEATGAMMLVGFHPANSGSPQARFAKWLEDGPKLAKSAGCYVGITVRDLAKAEDRS